MGKYSILAIILILLSSSACAELVINSPIKDRYNIGDKILLEGFFVSDKDTTGQIDIYLSCAQREKVMSKSLDIRALEKKSLAELGILNVETSARDSGKCKIEFEISSNAGKIAEAQTKEFEVTKTIAAQFSIPSVTLRLGEKLSIKGIAFKLDGSNLEGKADISLIKEGKESVVGTGAITAGQFSFSQKISNIDSGKYRVKIKVYDQLGNEAFFESVNEVTIDNSLEFTFVVNKNEFLPDETVSVSGNILSSSSKYMVTIKARDSESVTEVSAQNFLASLKIPDDFPAGETDIQIKVEDEYGNRASKDYKILIKQQPTLLDLSSEKSAYKPGEILNIAGKIYDQTGRPMQGTISVKGSRGKDVLFSENIESDTRFAFPLGKYAEPGEYLIEGSSFGMKAQTKVSVFEIKEIIVEINGQMIEIENTGNVIYDEPVDLVLTSKIDTFETSIKTNLKPGKRDSIDLGKSFPSASYDVAITTSQWSRIHQNVKIEDKRNIMEKASSAFSGITGNAVVEGAGSLLFDIPLYLFVFTLVLALFMFFKKPKTKKDIFDEIKHSDDGLEEKVNNK